eukprot:gnl/Chilomastix_cuspidata/3921.p1 GENE.gnl/Chilomastix_cuspidata/3921~~gnl/Chilomastix_cuspidata/3921.p1  ORF type:complete len:1059 (+),score=447.01 gnl/Chilomastix_cuspidata/3921:271-3447(+)
MSGMAQQFDPNSANTVRCGPHTCARRLQRRPCARRTQELGAWNSVRNEIARKLPMDAGCQEPAHDPAAPRAAPANMGDALKLIQGLERELSEGTKREARYRERLASLQTENAALKKEIKKSREMFDETRLLLEDSKKELLAESPYNKHKASPAGSDDDAPLAAQDASAATEVLARALEYHNLMQRVAPEARETGRGFLSAGIEALSEHLAQQDAGELETPRAVRSPRNAGMFLAKRVVSVLQHITQVDDRGAAPDEPPSERACSLALQLALENLRDAVQIFARNTHTQALFEAWLEPVPESVAGAELLDFLTRQVEESPASVDTFGVIGSLLSNTCAALPTVDNVREAFRGVAPEAELELQALDRALLTISKAASWLLPRLAALDAADARTEPSSPSAAAGEPDAENPDIVTFTFSPVHVVGEAPERVPDSPAPPALAPTAARVWAESFTAAWNSVRAVLEDIAPLLTGLLARGDDSACRRLIEQNLVLSLPGALREIADKAHLPEPARGPSPSGEVDKMSTLLGEDTRAALLESMSALMSALDALLNAFAQTASRRADAAARTAEEQAQAEAKEFATDVLKAIRCAPGGAPPESDPEPRAEPDESTALLFNRALRALRECPPPAADERGDEVEGQIASLRSEQASNALLLERLREKNGLLDAENKRIFGELSAAQRELRALQAAARAEDGKARAAHGADATLTQLRTRVEYLTAARRKLFQQNAALERRFESDLAQMRAQTLALHTRVQEVLADLPGAKRKLLAELIGQLNAAQLELQAQRRRDLADPRSATSQVSAGPEPPESLQTPPDNPRTPANGDARELVRELDRNAWAAVSQIEGELTRAFGKSRGEAIFREFRRAFPPHTLASSADDLSPAVERLCLIPSSFLVLVKRLCGAEVPQSAAAAPARPHGRGPDGDRRGVRSVTFEEDRRRDRAHARADPPPPVAAPSPAPPTPAPVLPAPAPPAAELFAHEGAPGDSAPPPVWNGCSDPFMRFLEGENIQELSIPPLQQARTPGAGRALFVGSPPTPFSAITARRPRGPLSGSLGAAADSLFY